MRDPRMVAANLSALREVHGDDLTRLMLTEGISLAAMIDALLRSKLKNHAAVKLITSALSSGDFTVAPDLGFTWHLKYFYDPPRSPHVVDIEILTPDRGTIASPDLHLRLFSEGG